mgnify:CR=1 FL=1
MKDRWIGLDIGGSKCAVLLAKLDHGIQLLDKTRFDTHSERGFEYTYNRLCREMEAILARNELGFERIRAIGISCGGPLDSKRGIILCPPNLPDWKNIPLPEMLQKKYGVQAFIQNDANACALVEWKMGAGRGTRNMVFLTMGTGMGAGIIAEGQLLQGHTDMGGEVGHLRLSEDGPVGFGKAGSFEGYASGDGMRRQAVAITKRMIEEGNPPAWIRDGHRVEEVDPRMMAEYARKGDPDACAFYEHTGRMLGRGIALLVDVLNPECVVIGSVFGRCEELLRPSMEKELRREALAYSLQDLRVVPAGTGESLGDFAGVMVALHALNIDPLEDEAVLSERVLIHYRRLFERYPMLEQCRDSVMNAYLLLQRCYAQGGKVLLVGNGGSCADCNHIVGELMKGFYLKRPLSQDKRDKIRLIPGQRLPGIEDMMQQGLPAIALTEHSALSTAVQNDLDPSLAAAQQVVGYGKPGDVVLGISTSGNAKNVLLALSVAKALGMTILGLTGETGGLIAEMCADTICVPGTTPADVQELHLPVYHTLCAMLEAAFFEA